MHLLTLKTYTVYGHNYVHASINILEFSVILHVDYRIHYIRVPFYHMRYYICITKIAAR